MSKRAYLTALLIVVIVAGGFRMAFGARGSFNGDDFAFRALMAEGLSVDRLFTEYNGHLNPLGLLLQWAAQQVFPGRYVPLMLVSAALIMASAAVAAWWFQTVFGRRWAGISVAVVVALSPTAMELMTWWSVAIYAGPLILTSWLTVQYTTLYALRRCALWVPLVMFAGAMLSSSKAIALPLVLVAVTAGLALGGQTPLGFRDAIRGWRLWSGMAGVTVAFAIIFAVQRGPLITADPTLGQMTDFMRQIWRAALLPGLWGGPWQWTPFGFFKTPAPSGLAMTISLVAVLLCAALLLAIRPRVWRVMAGSALLIVVSTAMVAFGRAGSIWAGPNLRYTVDLLLPVVITVCAGLFATRWEKNPRSPFGARFVRWRGWPLLGWIATVLWVVSVATSMIAPWRSLTDNWMKQWVTSVRTAYPDLQDGLLWQYAPRKVSQFSEPIDTFLAGDPDKPPQRLYVNDRLLGFDENGTLIDRYVQGVQAVPPSRTCDHTATSEQELVLPLDSMVGQGRHTVLVDYFLGLETAATVQLGDGPRQEFTAPPGARRVFVVVDGAGDTLRFTVTAPTAQLCVNSAVVGYVVDGPPVDPSTLPR